MKRAVAMPSTAAEVMRVVFPSVESTLGTSMFCAIVVGMAAKRWSKAACPTASENPSLLSLLLTVVPVNGETLVVTPST
jgi:hypothetical protein